MILYDKFYNTWKNKTPFNALHSFFVVAVSGGVDSVVLCYLLKQFNVPFVMAHCNFNLRGEESLRDQKFVENLAVQLKVTLHLKHFDTVHEAMISKESIQVTARNLRYNWFAQLQTKIAEEQKAKHVFLLTAHHANDNVETVMHHLIRGTGLNGLTGIDEIDFDRKICRPLLQFTKQEVLDFAIANNIEFVEDSSNELNKYTRNFIRNKLIPTIEEKFPLWQQNMQHNIARFNEAAYLYKKALQKELKGFIHYKNDLLHVPIQKLKLSPIVNTIIWEIFMPFGLQSSQIEEVVKLFDAHNAAYIKIDNFRIIKDRAWLVVVPNENAVKSPILIENIDNEIQFELGTIKFELIQQIQESTILQATQKVAYVPASLLVLPLVLRPFKTADYFYPFGMQKKKKLSRFFIDLKLSTTEKNKVWVVETNKKIVWIVGLRLDNRFKVLNCNEPIVKISIS